MRPSVFKKHFSVFQLSYWAVDIPLPAGAKPGRGRNLKRVR